MVHLFGGSKIIMITCNYTRKDNTFVWIKSKCTKHVKTNLVSIIISLILISRDLYIYLEI